MLVSRAYMSTSKSSKDNPFWNIIRPDEDFKTANTLRTGSINNTAHTYSDEPTTRRRVNKTNPQATSKPRSTSTAIPQYGHHYALDLRLRPRGQFQEDILRPGPQLRRSRQQAGHEGRWQVWLLQGFRCPAEDP